jgi:probable HAF family extracellular repeat protein
MTRQFWFVLLAASLAAAQTTVALGPYALTDLGSVPGSVEPNFVWNINAYGQSTGRDEVSPGVHAFLWSPTTPNTTVGASVDLGVTAGSHSSYGVGINSFGQVSGITHSFNGQSSFLWTPSVANTTTGSMVALPALTSRGPNSNAWNINDTGQVVGDASIQVDLNRTAVLWSPSTPNGTTLAAIDLTPGCVDCVARDINSQGQIVGIRRLTLLGQIRTALWTPDVPNGTTGAWVDINGMTGSFSTLLAINDYGQFIAGSGLWTPASPNGSTGSRVSLGVLPGFVDSTARDINSQGAVVGYSADGSNRHAFIWVPNSQNASSGALTDLNSLLDPVTGAGWTLEFGHALNDAGQIVGVGRFDPDGAGGVLGEQRSFLLTPMAVPEPASGVYSLLAMFLSAAAVSRPKRVVVDRALWQRASQAVGAVV